MDKPRPTDEEYRSAAGEMYCIGSEDDIEIDVNAPVSQNAEGGAWVQAWVYVRDTDCGDKYAEEGSAEGGPNSMPTAEENAIRLMREEEDNLAEPCQFDLIEDGEWFCSIHDVVMMQKQEPVNCIVKRVAEEGR